MDISLPHKLEPRGYQAEFFKSMHDYLRAFLVWHRRGGKDLICLNYMIFKAVHAVGVYYYFFPLFTQGKKALWDNRIKAGDGMRYMDYIPGFSECLESGKPKGIVKSILQNEMKVTLRNGSIIQIVGTEKFDDVMGTNPLGMVFSEFALQREAAWHHFEPIVLENGGWVIFNTTPRGHNHAWKMWERVKHNRTWLTSLLTIEDTGVITADQIQAIRDSGTSEQTIQQEYYCDWSTALSDAWYAEEMDEALKDKRIGRYPHDPGCYVHSAWDIGKFDPTAIWFFQVIDYEIHFINYFQDRNRYLPYYVGKLNEFASKYGYMYGTHLGPHDIIVGEWAGGKTRYEMAQQKYDINFIQVPKMPNLMDGINQVKIMLPRCRFDFAGCFEGVDHLRRYARAKNKEGYYTGGHVRDEHVHGADAFRTAACGIDLVRNMGDSRKYNAVMTRYAKRRYAGMHGV